MGWALALLFLAVQVDLPLALGAFTVFHSELLLAAAALRLSLQERLRQALWPWLLAALPLSLWLLAHAAAGDAAGPVKAVLRAAQFLLALALPALLLRNAAQRRLAWRGLFAAVTLSALWALAQSLGGPASVLNRGREMELIHGFQAAAAGMGHHNQLGAFLVAALAAAGSALLAGRERAWALVALTLGSAALLCTYSRGAWIGAVLAASFLLLRLGWRARLSLIAAAALLVLIAWSWPGGAFRARLQTLAADGERSTQRAALLEAGRGHGLWGLGPAGLDRAVQASAVSLGGGQAHPAFASHAHNSWLQWGLSWGWPVLLLWLLALAPLGRPLWAGLRASSPWALGLAGCLAAFGLQGWTDHLFLHARGAGLALVWGLLLAELQTEPA